MKKIFKLLYCLPFSLLFSSCESGFLEVSPSDQYSDSSVFVVIDGAQKVLTGAYDWMTNGWYAHDTNQYILFMPDVMGDDAMVNSTGNYNRFVAPYQYSFTSNSTYSIDPWSGCYSMIDKNLRLSFSYPFLCQTSQQASGICWRYIAIEIICRRSSAFFCERML